MNAVTIDGPGAAKLVQIERCSPVPGEILVRCEAAAICTVERQLFSGVRRVYPSIGGHEVSGVVEQCKAPESGLRPGDRVVLDSVFRCRQCIYCRAGQDHVCTELRKARSRYLGYVRIGGGFAEFTTISARQAVEIPAQVTFEEASLVEPLSCCIHSIRKSELRSDETLVVLGAGIMGALHALLGKLRGARTFVIDPVERRLELVRRHVQPDLTLNPTQSDPVAAVKELTGGRGAEVVVIAAGTTSAGEQGLMMAAPLGRVVFFASTQPPLSLDLDWNRLHYQELSLMGAAGKTERDFRRGGSVA